ncbi:hypothetical protein HMPREF0381_2647 [Lachnoanaerobaculum saburreum DSM 3986]|jgi:hypothetical protein|uniref:Uncharacterized protein n=2 Tax=Lachnoanaerobaculum TaxID=1164882 RepID=E6LRR2_9FIRM|nr:hypothetical protein HMPREF0381_2647 [Lachnoanaerobaculum saburreum DSM 3986]
MVRINLVKNFRRKKHGNLYSDRCGGCDAKNNRSQNETEIMSNYRRNENMLKIRISGATYELKDYLEHMKKDKIYQIISKSRPLKNKGTNRIFRVFTDVDKKTKIVARESKTVE